MKYEYAWVLHRDWDRGDGGRWNYSSSTTDNKNASSDGRYQHSNITEEKLFLTEKVMTNMGDARMIGEMEQETCPLP